jgi:hypothetical protein
MANPEHLKILKQGVDVWNQWRDDSPLIIPDLSDFNFNEIEGEYFTIDRIEGADLRNINLEHANLRGANLERVNLHGADLRSADLSSANLTEAVLADAILMSADFTDADLSGVSLYWTIFADTNLTRTKGLETCFHYDISSIDFSTIAKSGNIPITFLRECGLPETVINYLPSLLNEPIQFYKCFISFTEADDLFSERLYNDLQSKGVRCWRWKEDAKWGKTLMSSIDEAVRVYDKLIVMCSEQSLNSPAVIREIVRALQKEDDLARQGKDAEVLFPIRLDDYIFTGWNHHRKADVTAKNVGDFRFWNEPEKYKKAFDRLLRDLKAEAKKEPQTAEG